MLMNLSNEIKPITSNGFIEALKVKIERGKMVDIMIIPISKKYNITRPHIVWFDKADASVYEFAPCRPIRKWYKWILYRGYYRRLNYPEYLQIPKMRFIDYVFSK